MNEQLPYALVREGIMSVAVASAPILITLLVMGLIVGIVQAATQVNDTAVGFLPRLLAAVAALWLFGGWMMERLSQFLAQALVQMAGR